MKYNGLRVVASRLVDAMPVYARFMPLFVEKKNSRPKRGGSTIRAAELKIRRGGVRYLGQLIKNSQIVGKGVNHLGTG